MHGNESHLMIAANPAFRTRERNPHQFLLYTAIQKHGATVVEATNKRLLANTYDILHLHWADGIFNSRGIDADLASIMLDQG